MVGYKQISVFRVHGVLGLALPYNSPPNHPPRTLRGLASGS